MPLLIEIYFHSSVDFLIMKKVQKRYSNKRQNSYIILSVYVNWVGEIEGKGVPMVPV